MGVKIGNGRLFRDGPSLGGDVEETTLLKIGTLNVKNIESNAAYVKELLRDGDFFTLQEHWPFNYGILRRHLVRTLLIVRRLMMTTTSSIQKPRCYGGVAVLYSKRLNVTVKKLPLGRNRIVAIEVLTSPPLCLCRVYMPSRNSKQASTDAEE